MRLPGHRASNTHSGAARDHRFPDPRAVAAAASAIVVGALFAAGDPRARDAGATLSIVGAAGCAWWARQAWRAWNGAQLALHRDRLRSAIHSARRDRRERARMAAAATREAQRSSREASAARREANARKRELDAANAAARRTWRESAAARTAERILSMADDELLEIVSAAFAAKGASVLRPDNTGLDKELLIEWEERSRAVVRFTPTGGMATLADVQSLEKRRIQEKAATAYLYSSRGFSGQVVRALKSSPIVLLDPHLLAHWLERAGEDGTGNARIILERELPDA